MYIDTPLSSRFSDGWWSEYHNVRVYETSSNIGQRFSVKGLTESCSLACEGRMSSFPLNLFRVSSLSLAQCHQQAGGTLHHNSTLLASNTVCTFIDVLVKYCSQRLTIQCSSQCPLTEELRCSTCEALKTPEAILNLFFPQLAKLRNSLIAYLWLTNSSYHNLWWSRRNQLVQPKGCPYVVVYFALEPQGSRLQALRSALYITH